MQPFSEQFGRFTLTRRLAVGGMGEVFLARYRTASGIERQAVVKRILPHLTADPDFVSYFLNEGRITSLLAHPHVVQTLELGRINNQYYIAMEYVPGHTLVQLLATAMQHRRRFSMSLVMNLSLQLAGALEYIHGLTSIEGDPLHIVHMDLAPHNILVTPAANAKILDFGISRARGLSTTAVARDFRGRTAYLAPEQLDGLAPDHRVDIFALGVIMHEMTLCRPLFRVRSESQTATRILHSPIPHLSQERADCPERFAQVVVNALGRDREQRYASATQLLRDLDDCLLASSIVPSITAMRDELAQLTELVAVRPQHPGVTTGVTSPARTNTARSKD